MRPDRRFGVGRAGRVVSASWLAVMASAWLAVGQDWTPEPVDPRGHSGEVVAVASVGKTLATASLDGRAKVWDVEFKTLTHRLDLVGHDGKVLAVAVSPDGKLVATGGADRTVRLWDANRGTPLATLQGHSGPVEALAFAPDGKALASGGLDASIKLWDVAAKAVAKTLHGHEQGVRGLAFSPDGQALASAGRDHTVRLWNVPEGAERATLGRHDGPAWCVAFSPDGRSVASGGLDKTLRLWKVGKPAAGAGEKPGGAVQGADATDPARVPLQRQERIAVQTAFLVVQQPQQLVGPGGLIEPSQEPPSPDPNQIQAWQAGSDVVAVAFTPDGHFVAAALSLMTVIPTAPGSVAFFAMPPAAPNQPRAPAGLRATIRGHLGPIWGLAFSPDGHRVATVGGDASVRLWDASLASPLAASIGRARPEAVEERVMAHLDPVEALAFSPDGRRVATASRSAGVSLWDATTRTLIGRLALPAGPVRSLALAPDGRLADVDPPFAAARTLAFSPDGKLLATGGDGKVISLRDAATGAPIDTLKGHLGAITCLAFSPDGKALASGSADASVTLWDVAKKAEIATLARHTSAITSLAFAPDGSMLATAGLDFTVKLWELPSGRYVDTLDAHKDVVDALAFSLDGKALASADRSGSVRFWDLAGRAERSTIQAISGPIRALAFAPDGKTLVGGGGDGSIRRWDLADGKVVALRRDAHAGAIQALAFGPGGKILATGGADRELKLWDVDARLAPGPFADLEGKVRQLAVSRDGSALATASADQFVRIWDVATGRLRHPPIPLEGAEARIAFSPDGKFLATLSVNTSSDPAKVWDVATGHLKAQAAANEGDGNALAFAPDGKTWASNIGTAIFVRDLATGSDRDGMQAHGEVRSLAFSPAGKAVVVGLADGSVERVDQTSNRSADKRMFKSAHNSVDVLAFSPDGRSLAIGGSDRVVRVIDVETEAVRLALRGHRKPITGLGFSPDGKLLASASDGEAALFVWDLASGDVVSTPTLPDASHGEGLACLAFSPDGKALYAGGERGVITFDMTEGHRPPSHVGRGGPKLGKERATLRGHATLVRSLAFAQDGAKLVTRGDDGAVKVWDLLDGNRERHAFGGADFKVKSMALRPDGKTLAVGLELPANRLKKADLAPPVDEPPPPPEKKPGAPAQRMSDEVKFWDLDTGEGRGMINDRATNRGLDRVVALAYARDGRTLATTSQKGIIRTWDADSLEPKVALEVTAPNRPAPPLQGIGFAEGKTDLGPRDRAADIVLFSPDGKILLGADGSGRVTLWAAETGKVRAGFAHDGGINQVHISPDGRFIATGGGNFAASRGWGIPASDLELGPGAGGDVRLWDLATGGLVAVLPMESGKVNRIAFSGDGKSLAASTTGALATVWDVDSARPVVTLAWPSGEAKYLAFSPDGKLLATGGDDEALRVWDLPAGTLRAELLGHTDGITWIAFAPDGKTLATASRDTTVKLWDVP